MNLNPLSLIPEEYRLAAELIVLALALAAAGVCGSMVRGWKDGTELQTQRAAWAEERSKALGAAVTARDAAIKDRDAKAAQLAAIDTAAYENFRRSERENETLAARADAGTVRVRVVGAACPATHDVPQAGAGSGVDSGAGAELDANARRRYFALRGTLGRVQEQLAACQRIARTLTGQ